jgi:hypothetical protein
MEPAALAPPESMGSIFKPGVHLESIVSELRRCSIEYQSASDLLLLGMDLDHLFFAKPKLQSDPLIVALLVFVGGRFIPCPPGIYRHLRNQEHLDGSL